MPYLLDSDVLIDVSRGKQPAREYLDALPEGWAISRVSALELIVGARDNRDLTAIDAFLFAFVAFISLVLLLIALVFALLLIFLRSRLLVDAKTPALRTLWEKRI